MPDAPEDEMREPGSTPKRSSPCRYCTGAHPDAHKPYCRYYTAPIRSIPDRETQWREVLGTLDKDSPGIVAALWWALDLLDMYDKELLRRGDPLEKVNSPTHLEAKAKARHALNAALAALSVPGQGKP